MIRMLVSDPREFYLFVEEVSCFLLDPDKYVGMSRKYETEELTRWVKGRQDFYERGGRSRTWEASRVYVFLSTEGLYFQIHEPSPHRLFRVGKVSKSREGGLAFRGVLWEMLEDEITDIYSDLGYRVEFEK